jgi:dolichol-phosphate mannosyltransferase
VPTTCRNRRAGESKLAMREMGSRYLFIVLYAFLERHLSRGDYRRTVPVEPVGERKRPDLSAVGGDSA